MTPRAAPFALHAPSALLPSGWARDVRVAVDAGGRIADVDAGVAPRAGDEVLRDRILLPAPGNLHSHAFQRAMAGMAQGRGHAGDLRERDSFWTWRRLMYRFLDRLDPDDIEAVAALVCVETLEAGFAALGEFHYLHNPPGGGEYADVAETSRRIAAAAAATGAGLTLLPVLYMQGGCDGRPLEGGQKRFAADPARLARIREGAAEGLAPLPDAVLGVAPHSLRAAPPEALREAAAMGGPVHVHAAEQVAEVAEVRATLGAPPVRWLLDEAGAGAGWCLIHCTQAGRDELRALAASGAVAGLCAVTEADLGDGTFAADLFLAAGGAFGVGSDSNVAITFAGELRQLEYSQRLRDRARAVLCDPGEGPGRALWTRAAAGSAAALGRDSGAIAPGRLADLTALDAGALALEGLAGNDALDAFVFAGSGREVAEVWSAGRRVVSGGRHVARDAVEARARAVFGRLRAAL